ncbi:MAG TPA: DUF1638 domain-containing protein [Anaerolineaceae bacterium]
MKIKCLTCEALVRLVYHYAAQSPHMIDVSIFRLGLHNQPDDLRTRLQHAIDLASVPEDGISYQAIVLAYGLCGRATDGLVARSIPLVIPRAHDCITLFLGSRQKYLEQHENNPGTYWYALDYIERGRSSGVRVSLGAESSAPDMQTVYEEYVKKYGQDNADYLMEVMGAWQSYYRRAALINLGIGDISSVESIAREEAAHRNWTFEQINGDPILIQRLLNGDWNTDFLIVQPGERIQMVSTTEILRSAPLT